MSVVEATPQAYLLYVEQAPFVTHPAPLVVQVEITDLHRSSVPKVIGSKSQLINMHCFRKVSHPHMMSYFSC